MSQSRFTSQKSRILGTTDLGTHIILLLIVVSIGFASACSSARMPTPVSCTTLPAPAHAPEDMVFDADGNLWIAYGVSQLEGAVRLSDPTDGMCEHFHRENTLEIRAVSALAVDHEGNLWFGSWDRGDLVRFDGRRWRTFTEYDGSADEGNSVFDITAAPNGDLWVGIPYYAFRFDGREWTTYTVNDGLPTLGVTAIAVAADGKTWFGGLGMGDDSQDSSVASFDTTGWTTYNRQDGLVDNDVNDIAVSPSGVVWVGTHHGLGRFDGERWESKYTDHYVSDVDVDAAGGVWVATNRGVLHFDGETWTTSTEDNGLPNNDVGALAVAPNGTIWAGTREGISRFDAGSWLFYPIGEP